MKLHLFKQKKISTKKGFTLLETFVAITILMISIVGPLTIAQSSLSSAYNSRDRITAYYLAQDAIEYVRARRDTTFASGTNNWATFIGIINTGCPNKNTVPCKIDSSVSGLTIGSCQNDVKGNLALGLQCAKMMYNTARGMYGYCTSGCTGWVTTDFTRDIYIREVNTGGGHNEIEITVKIGWRGAKTPLVVREYLFDWK